MNRALLELWGRTWEDSVGRTCCELDYPDWHAATRDGELEEVKRTKRLVRGEVPFAGAQGLLHFDYSFAPEFDEAGEVESIAGTTRDTTIAATATPVPVPADAAKPSREAARMRILVADAHPVGDRMLIVALTGWGQERDRRESRAAGCDLHLVKPLDPADLEQLLDAVQRGDLQRSA